MKITKKQSAKRLIATVCACILSVTSVQAGGTLPIQAANNQEVSAETSAKAAAKIKKITLNKKSLTVKTGNSKTLRATLSLSKAKNAKITWSTSNKKVATVKNGKVTGVSKGTATITAKAGGKKASCKVTVLWNNEAKQAIMAYQKYLAQSMITWTDQSYSQDCFHFILADINSDGVPELMLNNMGVSVQAAGYVAVYCYCSGQVKRLVVDSRIYGYYPKKGIVCTGAGFCKIYYKISKNGNVTNLGSSEETYGDYSYYMWDGKKVTKSQFNTLLKKAAGSNLVKIEDSGWHKNTAANRKKIANLVKKKNRTYKKAANKKLLAAF